MLSAGEKNYCAALLALKNKEYKAAARYFEKAAPYFAEDKEFRLFYESTLLLVAVKEELGREEFADSLEIEEIFTNG